MLGNETAAKAKAFKAKTAAVAIVDFSDSPGLLVRCGLPCLRCQLFFSPRNATSAPFRWTRISGSAYASYS